MPVMDDVQRPAQIPIFASVPSKIGADQKASRRYVYHWLKRVGLEPRTVGDSDRSYRNPLHEVRTIARHCAGGLILGYRQLSATSATHILRVDAQGSRLKPIKPYYAPTPWNQLETGILFGLGLPLLVLKEDRIEGGIFDAGSSDVFVHSMPMPSDYKWQPTTHEESLFPYFEEVLFRWQALVRQQYYGDC